MSMGELVEFWVAIIEKLDRDGVSFELFTNGSQQDYSLALNVVTSVRERLSISCDLATRPQEPCQLAHLISQYRAVIASRLHAHIIATSYRVPSIGLLWDDKVLAFFKDTGREALVFDSFEAKDAGNVVEALYQVMDARVDETTVMEKQGLIADNVRAVLAAIGLL